MARFPGYGPKAYRDKNADKPVEDYVSQVNGREGTETKDPAKLGRFKNPTKAEREYQSQWDEQ